MGRSGEDRLAPWEWPVAVVMAACSCWAQAGCSGRVEAERTPPPPVVTVAEARRMTVPIEASTNGTTRALKDVSIRARVRGFLEEMHFEEGSDVRAGQLLFVIEEAPFRAKLDSAKAQLAAAEADLAKARQSKAREIAMARLALAQAQLLLARLEETRTRTLLARNAVSREEVDRAEADRKKAEAQVEAERANLEQAKADYEVNIQNAQASVEAARAAVREAELNLGYCRMYAPIDGRIGQAQVKVGNLVGSEAGADSTELATIQQLDPMGVDIRASSRYLQRATELIRAGLVVRIVRPVFEGEQHHPYPGRALFLDNRVDPTTSTFLVRAEVPNPQKSLLPGEYVRVEMTVGEIPDAVVVPEQSVMQTQAGEVVYVVDREGKVAVARVKSTQTYEGLRVIESGLEPGQTVIVEGLQLVRPGMAVRTEPAALPVPSPAAPGAPAGSRAEEPTARAPKKADASARP